MAKNKNGDVIQWMIVMVFTGIGLYFRLHDLDGVRLWIDEALFSFYIREGTTQEFPTVYLGMLFGLQSEYGLRMLSVIPGIMTIPMMFVVLKNKWSGVIAAIIVSVFPLFVFWSRMARPYAFAGLFIVLGWRWAWCYVIAIATTPISLLGIRVVRQNKYVLIGAFVIAVTLFYFREDAGRDWTIPMLLNSPRFFYLPLLVLVLYVSEYYKEFYLWLRYDSIHK